MGNLTNSFATTPVSEYDATKVATYNALVQILDSAINGRLAISTTGGTTTLTGTPAAPQAQNLFLDVSGTLASNGIIEIPVAAGTGRNRLYIVKNGTSGAFSLTVRKVGGTGVTVAQGSTAILLYNDTDIVSLHEGASGGTPSWTSLSLQNSWVTFGAPYPTAAYTKVSGIVWLRGLIKSGTVSDGTLLFTLPAGYRPGNQILRIVLSNDVVARVTIESNGEGKIYGGNNTYVNLNDVSFPAEA